MKYKELVGELNTYSDTHPNSILLWKHYLHQKRKTYHTSIQECEKAVHLFRTQPDIPLDTILFLYTFYIIKNRKLIT